MTVCGVWGREGERGVLSKTRAEFTVLGHTIRAYFYRIARARARENASRHCNATPKGKQFNVKPKINMGYAIASRAMQFATEVT